MEKQDAKELRQMSDDQLAATLKDCCTQLFRLKIQSQTERLDVPSELKRNRRLIARIRTIQNERNREAALAAAQSNDASDS